MIDDLRNLQRRVASIEAALSRLSGDKQIPTSVEHTELAAFFSERRSALGQQSLAKRIEYLHKVGTVPVALMTGSNFDEHDLHARDAAREALANWGAVHGRNWQEEADLIIRRHSEETIGLARLAPIEASCEARVSAGESVESVIAWASTQISEHEAASDDTETRQEH